MNEVIVTLMWLFASAAALPLLVLAVEVWLGIWRTKPITLNGQLPNTCILIPAHDEAKIIGQTLARLGAILGPSVRVLVVADNCTDDTAAIAREHGFEVLERFNLEKRGKGFALAFGRDHLRAKPPECVVVVDADCHSDPRSIADVARYSCATQSAVQARYVFVPDHAASPKVQISNFAFWIKNVVRQRGVSRVGGGAILTGTGMAFPWSIFDRVTLATGSIVEDLALSVELAQSGETPLFLEQAQVLSASAGEQATIGQRSRWEHGLLSVAANHAFALLKHGFRAMDRKVFLLGLHLIVPPLALLVVLSALIAAFLLAAAISVDNWYPFAVLVTSLLAALMGVLVNWALEGRRWLTPQALAALPFYLMWKLPIYGRFFARKRVGWVRTDRD
ncbi:Glycosyltransferase, catalytic subunit of cellulose synthase and poly-beta-1,6-N-acetylglucosamine synthase [Erythrobacter litoralis]|nr:glycosyltransferase family 2 protein [Erythrobacter litoralis]AOL22415.1 Glycosyltransferase, catalytic subunit of cellulose synthase and poly-beta-1,6-N-acetylglucosamine synthase [Erythrobacter litoralis]